MLLQHHHVVLNCLRILSLLNQLNMSLQVRNGNIFFVAKFKLSGGNFVRAQEERMDTFPLFSDVFLR